MSARLKEIATLYLDESLRCTHRLQYQGKGLFSLLKSLCNAE